MHLWHGTTTWGYKAIRKCGKILRSKDVDDTTEYIDNIVNKVAGKNIRGNCVYLCNDKETAVYGWDRNIYINSSKLDIKKLFVAEYTYTNLILGATSEVDLINAAKGYISSIKSFEYYLENRTEYTSPEFLYFGDIRLKQ